MMAATPEGTAAFAKRHSRSAEHFRPALGLTLSSVGMGSYLGKDDDATDVAYAAAVGAALARGVNVFDCAINYRHQRSERALGKGLRAAFAAGEARREEVMFCTKAGYLPFDGKLPADPGGYLREEYVVKGILDPVDIAQGCHAMSPRYLRDQVGRSLANTGLDAIDVFYVHNPETQLDEISPAMFLQRWKEACVALEALAKEGKIRAYGAATWAGLRTPPGDPGHLALEKMVAAAAEAGGKEHRFRVLQFPYNLAMLEGALNPTQNVGDDLLTVTEAAARLGLVCFTSVPLLQGKLAKNLPDTIRAFCPGLKTDAQRALQFVRATPGIVAPLAGMRSGSHVEENTAVVEAELPPRAVWEALFAKSD